MSEEGPYRVVEDDKLWLIVGPSLLALGRDSHMNVLDNKIVAEAECHLMNAAYAAGQGAERALADRLTEACRASHGDILMCLDLGRVGTPWEVLDGIICRAGGRIEAVLKKGEPQ